MPLARLSFFVSSFSSSPHFKLIDISSCVYPVYSKGLGSASTDGKNVEGIRQTAEEAYAIRAATLAACEKVVELAPSVAEATGKEWLREIDAMGMDGFLWQFAKVGDLRRLPRLAERGTVYY